MKTPASLLCALFAALAPAFAQSTATGGNASLLHAPAGDLGGGGRIANASATIVADISIGDPAAGFATNASAGGVVTKGNLVGQLTDMRSLTLTTAATEVAEGATVQLSAQAVLDDATVSPVPATSVAWSAAGPITGINANGLATAALVFQNTAATVQGASGGLSATRAVTVVNVNADNFGAYAADGLDDDWQARYFGQPPNALAAPTADPDGDGQTNRAEFLSGFAPTDATSFLRFTILGVSRAGVVDFRVNKAIPGRTYTLLESASLTGTFVPLSTFSVVAEETDKPLQDPAAPAGNNFYRLEIARP